MTFARMHSDELSARHYAWLLAARNLMTRDEFFASLFIVGCANGLGGKIIDSIKQLGWEAALVGTFGISAIVWIACLAGILFILRQKRDHIRSVDLIISAGFLVLTFLPVFKLSWMAVTGLSIYLLLSTRAHTPRWRGAVILLATTMPMCWSPLLLNFFPDFILKIDALLGSLLLGTERIGNMIRFADDSGYLIIFPYCSSLSNMSVAFLSWITITQSVEHRWSYHDLIWCSLACFSVVAVNVIRISLMGLSGRSYEMVHGEWGGLIVNIIILCLTIGISVFGVRREFFARI
jgi:hypothetical protein